MLKPSYNRQFERDLKKMLKQGKQAEKLKTVIRTLSNEDLLNPKYKDHKLVGNYKGRRESHGSLIYSSGSTKTENARCSVMQPRIT